jgi:hypothetical protein
MKITKQELKRLIKEEFLKEAPKKSKKLKPIAWVSYKIHIPVYLHELPPGADPRDALDESIENAAEEKLKVACPNIKSQFDLEYEETHQR